MYISRSRSVLFFFVENSFCEKNLQTYIWENRLKTNQNLFFGYTNKKG